MELKKIEIEGYKGISYLTFNPKKINLLLGKNNTCKTTLIEAIDLLFDNDKIQNRNMGSYFNIYSREKIIKLCGETLEKKEQIELKDAEETEVIGAFRKELIENFLTNLSRKSKKTFSGTLTKELEKVVEKNIDSELRSSISRNSLILSKDDKEEIYYGIYDFSLIDNLENLIDSISDYILNTLPEELKQEYKRYLRYASEQTLFLTRGALSDKAKKNEGKNIIYIDENSLSNDFRRSFSQRKPEDSAKLYRLKELIKENNLIENFKDLDFDNVTFFSENEIKSHPLIFLGDGVQSIIGFLWKFLDKVDNSVILFDEPETHMRPGYTKQLVKFILDFSERMNIQFFIVTHSPDILDIIFSKDLDENMQEYLKKELNILRMNKIGEETDVECLGYQEAKETRDDLFLDLRGI